MRLGGVYETRGDSGQLATTAIARHPRLEDSPCPSTKNPRAAQLVLGQTRVEVTFRYIGLKVDGSLEMAMERVVRR